MKAVIYARVSTDQQTTGNQIPILKAWASQLNMFQGESLEVIDVFSEQESAWKDGHQVELPRMIAEGQRGKFKVVLVWALDRLTRLGPRASLELVHKLDSFGIIVFSYQEQWLNVTDRNLRELLISLAGYIAKAESERRSSRTKEGLKRILREGRTKEGRKITKLGRPSGSRDSKKRVRGKNKKGRSPPSVNNQA